LKRRDRNNAQNFKGGGFKSDEPISLANDIEVDMDIQADKTREYSTLVSENPSEN
jgi:hypothetical protein